MQSKDSASIRVRTGPMLPLSGGITPTTSLIFLLIAGDCSAAMARKSVCPIHEMRICISAVHKDVCVRYKQNYAWKQQRVKRGTRCHHRAARRGDLSARQQNEVEASSVPRQGRDRLQQPKDIFLMHPLLDHGICLLAKTCWHHPFITI